MDKVSKSTISLYSVLVIVVIFLLSSSVIVAKISDDDKSDDDDDSSSECGEDAGECGSECAESTIAPICSFCMGCCSGCCDAEDDEDDDDWEDDPDACRPGHADEDCAPGEYCQRAGGGESYCEPTPECWEDNQNPTHQADEPRDCPLNKGVCAIAKEICVDGVWSGCGPTEYGPNFEDGEETRCDGLDNNCDGVVDGIVIESCSLVDELGPNNQGNCAEGRAECEGGVWTCTIHPQTEICDTYDNDCDGVVDEGC